MAWSAMTTNWSFESNSSDIDDLTLVTNFDRNQRGLYQYCIDWYNNKRGDEILYIEDVAYNQNGSVVERLHGLHSNDKGCGLSDFWRFFDNAKDNNSFVNHMRIKKPKKWVG